MNENNEINGIKSQLRKWTNIVKLNQTLLSFARNSFKNTNT